jgi:hypothetical protein
MLARVAVAVLLGSLGLCGAVATADGSSSHQRFANCTDAVAVLGPGKARINLRVDCWAPRRGGEFGFSVARLDSHGDARTPGIRRFDRHPMVTGPGAGSAHARCGWWQYSFGCFARSHGAITLHEQIRVRPGKRCAKRISITTSVTTCEPTVRTPCPAVLTIARLFDGFPRGC